MSAMKYWKALLAVFLVIVIWRAFIHTLPVNQQHYTALNTSAELAASLPQVQSKRDAYAVLDVVLNGHIWGWPQEQSVATTEVEADVEETMIYRWQFVGVYFDGRQWFALVMEEDSDDGVTKYTAGDVLISGQSILAVGEDEMRIRIDADSLHLVVSSQVDANDVDKPYLVLSENTESSDVEVLVKVGFNFGQL